uniref:Peptidase S1 domain-containing protein n=1 Tax=Panagrolaimus sp. PS1159 TaxID=55785 RepID=A0AC35FU69_9BILA
MAAEKLILFFAAIFLLQKNVYGFNQDRILNGSATPEGAFEFLPSLTMVIPTNNFLLSGTCSSTIISKRHILTAAHCIFYEKPSVDARGVIHLQFFHTAAFLVDYRPKNNIVKDPNNRVQIPLKDYSYQPKFYVHPAYATAQMKVNDIAIIEFPVGTDLGIAPIPLISNFIEKDGDMAIAAGYGVYKMGVFPNGTAYSFLPDVLQNVSVVLHSTEQCKDTEGQVPTLICTGTSDYRAAQGDSGGPLLIERYGRLYQVGVLSAGLSNNALYTPLSLQCDWISKVTNKEVNCQTLPVGPNPPPPRPDNKATQTVPSNNKTITTSLPGTSKPEAQHSNGNSGAAFAFNVLLWLLIGIFYFA